MTRARKTWPGLLAAVALAALPAGAQTGAKKKRPTTVELGASVEQIAGQVKNAEDNLLLVETQYTRRAEPSREEMLLKRFSDGEIQYLLGDFKSASVLFYDLISDDVFRQHERFAGALYYLSDSLYQQQNYIGARLYLRELLALRSRHYREALARYLEIAGRLNEFDGIEGYIQQARNLTGGTLPPELAYVYAKWMFKRTDLPTVERLRRTRDIFWPIAQNPGPMRLQAAYFLAVASVQEGKYDEAIEQFRRIVETPSEGPNDLEVKELSNLSLGRVLYEIGRYDEAVDRYQEIRRDSQYFVDSLYEIAWTQVRKGEYEKARNATDLLLLVAPESTVAPEAKILQGHLLLKLQKYEEATDTYNGVINTYAPVRDEIDALLTVNKDPVAYFDNLLARNDRQLDVSQLLPPVALKWATTQREVADAVRIVDDLETGRRGVGEANDIAARILKGLEERGLETFPELQEGYIRADAVDTALTRAEESLVRLEGELVGDLLSAEQQAELERIWADKAELEKRFSALPKTQAEVEARRQRLKDKVLEIDREAFKLGYEIQSLYAVVQAIDKWIVDTRAQRSNTPEDERAFQAKVQAELNELVALEKSLEEVRKQLQDQRDTVAASIGGEDVIRTKYGEILAREHELMAQVESRVGGDATRVMTRAHELRTRIAEVRQRVTSSKGVIRDQVRRRGEDIKEKVLAEQRLLQGYDGDVSAVSGEARNLVGRIAFDSFQRVRQQFYDLVLKADVGVVDVSFTRKQDRTSKIQDLSQKKDRELQALDAEFKEVLKDVD
ncbi:MAG: tetratricopeptide repeat protein [Myxococcaceae bacterium]